MKRLVAWGLPCAILLALLGWRIIGKTAGTAATQAQQDQRKRAAPSVELATAGPATIEETVEAVGSVESPYSVNLAAKTSARIDYLAVREGADVVAGQILVRLDPSELDAQVLQQQANVAQAQARLAQAALTQGATDTGIAATIRQAAANAASAETDFQQVKENVAAQNAAATAQIADADAKVAGAGAQVEGANADLQSASANLDNARTRLARIESLYRQKFIAAQDVDDARAAVKVQEGAQNVARQKLSAARSALDSAKAQRSAVGQQAQIVRRKGLADIEASRAKVVQARAAQDVAGANAAQSPAYRQNLAALAAGVKVAQAQLTQARAKRADATLRSPLTGTVTGRKLDEGTMATAGSPILTIQFLDWLNVASSLPIEQSTKIRAGQPAVVELEGSAGKEIRGIVADVNAAAEPASRQFSVHVRVANRDKSLRPGMFGRVRIIVGVLDARVVVPREAVKQTGEASTVVVVSSDGTANERKVVLGATNGASWEIKSGLKAGEKVVTLSYSPVRDGQKVRVGKGKP